MLTRHLRWLFSVYRRECSVAAAYALLLLVMAAAAPGFYTAANWRDLVLSNLSVLVVAVGMTLVILTRQIDISVGSQFALCGVAAGLLAKSGMPVPAFAVTVLLLGATLGAVNGALVTGLNVPSIIVTLGTMVTVRDGLRWATQGAWVQDLPKSLQWFGLGQSSGQALMVMVVLVLYVAFAWALRNLAAGRLVYATGSDAEAARLAGIQPQRVTLGVFMLMGVLTAIAAVLNSARFISIQSNAGTGLELKVIACVVVGGTSINGGRGTLAGTLLGVALLGTIGSALTFLHLEAAWEKAVQGAVILLAVASDALELRRRKRGRG